MASVFLYLCQIITIQGFMQDFFFVGGGGEGGVREWRGGPNFVIH